MEEPTSYSRFTRLHRVSNFWDICSYIVSEELYKSFFMHVWNDEYIDTKLRHIASYVYCVCGSFYSHLLTQHDSNLLVLFVTSD